MKQRAFTMVEVLVAAMIFSFILAGIFMVMNAGKAVYDADQGRLDLQASARRALDIVSAELRQTSLANITVGEDGTQIQFEVPSDISSGVTQYSGTISYYLNDDSQLIREYPAGTQNIIARFLSDIQFCCWDGSSCVSDCGNADSVVMRFLFNTTVDNRVMEMNVTEKVVVRNAF